MMDYPGPGKETPLDVILTGCLLFVLLIVWVIVLLAPLPSEFLWWKDYITPVVVTLFTLGILVAAHN